MSESYADDANLVRAESNFYDLGLDTTVALSIVGFLLGLTALVKAVSLDASGGALGSFFLTVLALTVGGITLTGLFSYLEVVPITSKRVRGIGLGLLLSTTVLTVVAYALPVTLATLLGLVLLFEAVAVVVAGVVSRLELVDTTPSMSAGLLAGGAFGFLGLLVGATVGGTLFSFGSVGWLLLSLLGGAGMTVLAVAPREDLGSTLPVGIVVGLFGAAIVTGLLGVGWEWNPDSLSGGFSGGVVVPIFVLFGSLLSSWAGAKARAGFGAQGRQYGAFFLINLNALLMVVIMASVVAFVVRNGIVYAVHGFEIGALSLLVVLAPLLVLALNWAREPAGTDEWHSAARQFFRVVPLAAIGSLATVLVGIALTGSTLSTSFEYTVLQDRAETVLDTSAALTPSLDVGAWLLVFSMAVLAIYFLRRAGSLQNVGERDDRIGLVRQAVSVFVSVSLPLVAFMAVFGQTFVLSVAGASISLPIASVLGLPLVALGTLGAAALAGLAVSAFARGSGSLPERATANAQSVSVGIYGSLATLTTALLVGTTAGVNPIVGPMGLVPTVGFVLSVAAAGFVALAVVARRNAESAFQNRILGTQLTLGVAAIAGGLALVGLHAALVGVTLRLGAIHVAPGGSFSWPFVMEAKIPLAPDSGGIFPAIIGTVWLVIGASLFAIPLGVGAAVFLTEYAEQGYFTGLVEIATNALWSTPSVVFGLFGAAFLLPRFQGDTSLIAGMLVLGFMLLPLVLITSREAIKAVPDEYRDASAALGVDRWTTVRSVVLPAAMPGVITGVILGVGRIAGETAPLILVLGSTLSRPEALDVLGSFELLTEAPFIYNDAVLSQTPALPTGIWAIITAGVSGSTSRGWATAFVLLSVVLLFYAIGIMSRTYFRRKLNYE